MAKAKETKRAKPKTVFSAGQLWPVAHAAWVAIAGDDANAYPGDALTVNNFKQRVDAAGMKTAVLVSTDLFMRDLTGWDPNGRKMAGTQYAKDRPKLPFSGSRALQSGGRYVGGKVLHKAASKVKFSGKSVNGLLRKAQKATVGRPYVEV